MKLISVILALALLIPVLTACGRTEGSVQTLPDSESGSETLAFFKSLDYSDGMSVVKAIFARWPLQYGTTLGLNGAPQIRPITII